MSGVIETCDTTLGMYFGHEEGESLRRIGRHQPRWLE